MSNRNTVIIRKTTDGDGCICERDAIDHCFKDTCLRKTPSEAPQILLNLLEPVSNLTGAPATPWTPQTSWSAQRPPWAPNPDTPHSASRRSTPPANAPTTAFTKMSKPTEAATFPAANSTTTIAPTAAPSRARARTRARRAARGARLRVMRARAAQCARAGSDPSRWS